MKRWKIEFKPAKGRGPWFGFSIEANTKEGAIAKGWRFMDIEGGSWKLAKVIELTEAAA